MSPRPRPETTPTSRAAVPITRNAWRDALWTSGLPPAQRFVAFIYADHAAAHGSPLVYVTVERLEQRSGYKRSTVLAAVRDLVRAGWLELAVKAAPGRSPRYRLTVPAAGLTVSGSDTVTDGQQCQNLTLTHAGTVSESGPDFMPLDHITKPPPSSPSQSPRQNERRPAGRGGGATPNLNSPQPTAGALGDVLPAGALALPKVVKSRPALAAALAAAIKTGWSPQEVREALEGGLGGAIDPGAVLVARLRALAGAEPPHVVARAAADQAAKLRELDAQRLRTFLATGGVPEVSGPLRPADPQVMADLRAAASGRQI